MRIPRLARGLPGAALVVTLVVVAVLGGRGAAATRAHVGRMTLAGGCAQDHGVSLGTVFTDGVVIVPTCGPIPDGVAACDSIATCPVYPYPGAPDPYPGYQCVELTARYLWYRFGAAEQVANGDDQAAAYARADPSMFTLVANGTVGDAPHIGDVLSMSAHADFEDEDGGHVAIVQSVSPTVASTGTGTIYLVDQNDQPSGTATLSMRHWRIEPGINGYAHFEWLAPIRVAPVPVWLAVRAPDGTGFVGFQERFAVASGAAALPTP
jgi:hypothetical protein